MLPSYTPLASVNAVVTNELVARVAWSLARDFTITSWWRIKI
jgi:hypothetical protein